MELSFDQDNLVNKTVIQSSCRTSNVPEYYLVEVEWVLNDSSGRDSNPQNILLGWEKVKFLDAFKTGQITKQSKLKLVKVVIAPKYSKQFFLDWVLKSSKYFKKI